MDLNLLFDRLKNGVTGRIEYYGREVLVQDKSRE